MANHNEEKAITQLEQMPPETREDTLAKKANPKCPRTHQIILGIIFLFSLIAFLIALFNVRLNSTLQQKLIEDNQKLSKQLQQLEAKSIQLKEQVDSKEQNIGQAQQELQNKILGLDKQFQTATQQKLYENQDWILLKVRYYLELSQINAHWSDNYATSIALLDQADNLLAQLNIPKVLEIRQLVAKEIALLKATPSLDQTGLLSKLDAAQISVLHLSIQGPLASNQSSIDKSTAQKTASSDWRNRLQQSMGVLEKLVVVRRNDEEIKPLISPLYESLLRESICLYIQEAQWAVLNNNSAVYQLGLKQAINNIKRTFNAKTNEVAVLLKDLDTLQQTSITPSKPNVGLALPLINQIIENQESRAPQEHLPGQGGNRL
ncbi:MAG: uroporphyrinogen-III C-methyltransferase [bacterium]|nr:uroporphyrinogen-III C-methyltransferase [bacterium]